MNFGLLLWLSEVINCVIMVYRDTKMAAAAWQDVHHFTFHSQWSVTILSAKRVEEVCRLAYCSVFHGFVSSPAKEKLDELWCASPNVLLTAERLDHT